MFSNWLRRRGLTKNSTSAKQRRTCLRVSSLEHRITPALNDNFADAYNLAGQFDAHFWGNYEFDPVTFDFIEYTGEVGEPDHAGVSAPIQSAWYRWTAPISAPTTIDVLDFSFAEFVNIGVYTGSAVYALTEVTSVSNEIGADAYFDAIAGTTYSIAIDNVGANLFDYELILSSFPRPANDDLANATVLDGSFVPVAVGAGTSSGSTFEPGEPDHGEGLEYFGFPVSLPHSTWFSWTAPTTGSVQLKVETDIDFGNTLISGLITGLAVYTGPTVDQLTLSANSFGLAGDIAVNDDFLYSGVELSFNSVAGTTYRIAVAGDALFPESYSLKLVNYAVPGAIAIDGTGFVVGTAASDHITVSPAGSASDGSTGIQIKTLTGGPPTTKTLAGPLNGIEIFAAAGNNTVTVADAITLHTIAEFGPGNDRYQGGNGPTVIYAGEGNNVVRTGSNSTNFVDVYAGNGNDDIRTGGGIDFIRPGDGNNTVNTGAGNDGVFLLPVFTSDIPFSGKNFIDLGSGNDQASVVTDGPTEVRGGSGNDIVTVNGMGNANLTGGDGNDSLRAGDGNNFLSAGAGNDFVNAGTGNNVIDAGDGNDQVTVGSFFAPGVGVNLIHSGSGNDVVRVSSNVLGVVFAGDGDDEVVIGFKPSFFTGPAGTGAGVVFGGGGNDILLGGPSGDLLFGDSGNDLISGGLGADALYGGAGSDLLFDGQVKAASSGDTLRQILNDWDPASAASYINVRSRCVVTFDSTSRDFLLGGSDTDWFWSNDPLDVLDRMSGEIKN